MALMLAAPFIDKTNAGLLPKRPNNRRHVHSSFSFPSSKSAAPCTLSLASASASVASSVDLSAQDPPSIVPFPGELDIPEPISVAPAYTRRRANSLIAPSHPRRRVRRASSLSPLNKPRSSANSDLQLMRLVQRTVACRLRSRSSSPAQEADSDEAMDVDEQPTGDVAELLAAQDRLLYERLSAYLAKRGGAHDGMGMPCASPPQVVASLIMRHNDRTALRARSSSRSNAVRDRSPARRNGPKRITSPLGWPVQV
ncbi:hypothetical protein BD626DRAFT_570571 [Schizophyllum amplum]|uniref:Uncharacterized protein n=1 Tax=Schizophyllum amplum TaxID=97359 RepID=A0A550CAP5_9AGAR|nr:hypothetical protein BD626DRAFT_570571 [Auriculariopsis ampla]